MQKVVYSISKVNKDEKLKGVGYLIEGNLLIPSTSNKGNPYIRVFEDVEKTCRLVKDSENEFKGYVTVAYENVNVYNKEKKCYDTLDYVETTYYIWYKFIDWGENMNEYSYFNGDHFIKFYIIEVDEENSKITLAINDEGKIWQDTFDLLTDRYGNQYFKYGLFDEVKIELDDFAGWN